MVSGVRRRVTMESLSDKGRSTHLIRRPNPKSTQVPEAQTSGTDGGPAIVVLQEFCVGLTITGHGCRTDLA